MNQPILSFTLFNIAAIILLIIYAICFAQEAAVTTKFEAFVKAGMQESKVSGISLAVVKDGNIILAKGYGQTNVELRVPVKPETFFQSGSMDKQSESQIIR